MIKSISDFLEELKKNGIEIIKKSEYIKHPGLIGEMYEGLTNDLLNKSIFKDFDLRISSGKIKNNSGDISSQIDSMLVVGEGEIIPFTDKKVYHYSQVIAILEVKKNLNKKEILDSFAKMQSVTKVCSTPDLDGEPYIMRMLSNAWKLFTNTELPERNKLEKLPEYLQYTYHILFMEAFLPLRITFGYFGYKSEYSLRNSFWKILEEKVNIGENRGFGIGSFPSMIICENNSLLKCNGMPNAVPFQNKEFYWSIYLSTNKNPLMNLLDLIWTRLSFKFKISSTALFDDGLISESIHRFIDCKFESNEQQKGWSYSYIDIDESQLQTEPQIFEWKPVQLNKIEFIIINKLLKEEKIKINDKDFQKFILTEKINVEQTLKRLHSERLIFYNESEIKLSTEECLIVCKNGIFYAGENSNGLMSKWINKVTHE